MAGRGRGRGRGGGGMTPKFLELIGMKREDVMKMGANEPPKAPPVYPPIKIPTPPQHIDPEILELVEIKRKLRAKLRAKSAHLTIDDKKKDIERYSDRYHQPQKKWTPTYWCRFPDELRPDWAKVVKPTKKAKKRRTPMAQPNLKAAKTSTPIDTGSKLAKAKEQLGGTLAGISDKEKQEDERKEQEQEKAGEEERMEEEEEEGEEFEGEEDDWSDEEDNDYNLTYFDNGEGYGDDDDDDEPSYD